MIDIGSQGGNLIGPPREAAKEYYTAIQGLRGFAAVSVFCLHLYEMALHGQFFPAVPTALEFALSTLGQGVGLFFIVSGFVIPASLVRHRDLRRFFADRCLRIMPLFIILHLLIFTIGPLIGYKWLLNVDLYNFTILFLSNLTFIALPLGLPLAQQNSWTLTYEWAFYLLVGAMWFALAAPQKRVFLIGVCCILGVICCWQFPICLYFVIGMLFARFRPTLGLNPFLELVLVPVCLVSYYYIAQTISIAAAGLPATVFFWAVIQPASLTSKALSTKPLQFLGLISYSFYLVHPIAVFPFQLAASFLARSGVNNLFIFICYLVCSIFTTLAASVLSYHLIEVRLRTVLAGAVKSPPSKSCASRQRLGH